MDTLLEKKILREYIANGNLDLALTHLSNQGSEDIKKDVQKVCILYDDIAMKNSLGILGNDDYNQAINKITILSLNIIDSSGKDYTPKIGNSIFISPYQKRVLTNYYAVLNPNHDFFYGSDYYKRMREESDITILKKSEKEIRFIEGLYKDLLINGHDYVKIPIHWYEYESSSKQNINPPKIYLRTESDLIHSRILETISMNEWEENEKIVHAFLSIYLPEKAFENQEIIKVRGFLEELFYCINNNLNLLNFQGLPDITILKELLPFDLLIRISQLLSLFNKNNISLYSQRYSISSIDSKKFKMIIEDDLSQERKYLFSLYTNNGGHSHSDFFNKIDENGIKLNQKFEHDLVSSKGILQNMRVDKPSLNAFEKIVNNEFLNSLFLKFKLNFERGDQILFYDYSNFINNLDILYFNRKTGFLGVSDDVIRAYDDDY